MGEKSEVFIRRASGLVRVIGPWSALAIAFAMPGIYNFVYLGLWGTGLYPEAYMPLGVASLLILIPVMLLFYMLGTAMPRSGGEYVYTSRILHPMLGFFTSWVFTIVYLIWVGDVCRLAAGIGIGYAFMEAGLFTNNQMLYNIGYTIYADLPTRFLVSTILVLLIGIIIWRGAKATTITMWIVTILATVGIVCYIGGFAMYGNELFKQRLVQWSGVNYDQIIQSARDMGWPGTFTISSSIMAGATYVLLETLGNQGVCTVAGEIKEVHKALPLALIGSLALFMVYWGLGYYVTFEALGPQFVSAIGYLNANGEFPLGVEPMWHYLLAYASPNLIVPLLATIGFIPMVWAIGLGGAFFATRSVFAWSFDRIIPTAFAKVDKRGSPWATVLLCTLLSEVFVYLWLFAPEYMGFSLHTITLWAIGWILIGLVGIVFPFKKTEIFDKAPEIVRKRVGGIPVITILGVLTVLVGAFIVWSCLVPCFQGLYPAETYAQTVVVLIALPIVIYYASKAYHKSRGVPTEFQFKELPPE
jgi:amino acid transporter